MSVKHMKLIIVTVVIMAAIVALFWGTFDKTSDVSYCASCHMMKPEFYTWKASSHNQLQCVQCHVEPGVIKKVKYKLFSVKEWYAVIADDYGILIQSTAPIPDATCNVCHDMSKRVLTPSGDLIVPHSKHAEMGIGCTKCHTGIAHGDVAKKQMTFKTEYNKWDDTAGMSVMSDVKNLRPSMGVCMDCHKVRNATLACGACHRTSMIPASHKDGSFMKGGHGDLSNRDIKYCDSCHSYMGKEKVEVVKGSTSKVQQFLNGGKAYTISVADYTRANTFCKDCHSKRPASHDADFPLNHGEFAIKDKTRCFTCHNNQPTGGTAVAKVTCGSCHPSVHYKDAWRVARGHPVELPPKPKLNDTCFTCHNKQICANCHKEIKK